MVGEIYKGSLEYHGNKIRSTLMTFWMDLLTEKQLDKFPYKTWLEKTLDKADYYVRDRDVNKVPHYIPGIKKFRGFLEYVRDGLSKLKDYAYGSFTENFWDSNSMINYSLKDVLSLNHNLQEANKLLDFYEASASSLPKPERAPISRSDAAIVAVLVIIAALGSFILLGKTEIGRTGFAFLPAIEILGVNFVTLYIFTSAAILSIYVLGKLLKIW